MIMSAIQLGCRLACFQQLLQRFDSPPAGTVLSPADVCNQHLLACIYTYLVSNWNSWGEEEAKNIYRLGDMIVSVYDQPLAVIDLSQDNNMEVPEEIQEEQQEWLVIDELQD